MRQPNVVDHADAGDLVVTIALGKSAVIANCYAAPIGKPRVVYSLPGERCLVVAERDPCRIDAVALGGVHDVPAPTAADVQQAIARLETKLPANQIQLCFLGDVE